jgi:UDPglucose--hexose-1-phosphate uridylyltransferase
MDEEVCDADPLQYITSALLRAEPVIGRCYVLTYSANHHYTLSDMTSQEVLVIIEAWTKVYARYLSPSNPLRMNTARLKNPGPGFTSDASFNEPELRYMHIFDNNGEIVGCSNSHPHGQIWITSSMPDEPRLELAQMSKYREDYCGRNLLEDYIRLEMETEERVVWQNGAFLAVCPWWAVWPFEILLLPKRRVRGLVEFNQDERFRQLRL